MANTEAGEQEVKRSSLADGKAWRKGGEKSCAVDTKAGEQGV